VRSTLETSSLEILSSALDAARVGFAHWDAEDRLVAFNDTYVTLVYPGQQAEVRLGRRFAELVQTFYGLPSNVPAGRTAADMMPSA
jgi:hypothetical protein